MADGGRSGGALSVVLSLLRDRDEQQACAAAWKPLATMKDATLYTPHLVLRDWASHNLGAAVRAGSSGSVCIYRGYGCRNWGVGLSSNTSNVLV